MNSTDFLFEVSWEVCNKVGGIHTVIASKAKVIMEHVDNYYVLGPYTRNDNFEFSELEVPESYKSVYEELLGTGIKVHFGKWNVEGSPNAILVEYLGFSGNMNNIKSKLWEDYKIDSLNSYWNDFDEVILWSWCCGIVIEKISNSIGNGFDVFVHAHEWISGGSIFYINTLNSNRFKTVFTTHATMLGRALCGIGENIYEIGDKIDPNQKSYELNVYTKQQTEKALALNSGAFTTVSRITAREAENFYGKYPDRLLFNGFDNFDESFYENMTLEFQKSRDDLNYFLKNYFSQYYDLDFNEALVIYTSGRNEFRNKGIGVFIKALGELNKKLIEENSNKTVISLFLIPIGDFQKDPRFEKQTTDDMKSSLWQAAPLSTHLIPTNNEVIKEFMSEHLFNRKEDKVKVILMPIYLHEKDGFFNKGYYDVVKGMNLGVFPSFYEPWGYTPLESIALGVPAITSDLAGFGRTVEKEFGGNKAGVKVLKREKQSDELVVDNLYNYLYSFSQKDNSKQVVEKRGAYVFSKNFSWHLFIKNYLKAYEIARKSDNSKLLKVF